MLSQLLKKSDWAFLLDFVSPAFFKVIPPLELINNATSLAKRSQDRRLYQNSLATFSNRAAQMFPCLRTIEGQMQRRGFEIESFTNSSTTLEARQNLANLIVELYFAQLYSKESFFLDVRLSRFAIEDEDILWSPAPLLGVFSNEFSESMCSLYEGYYNNKHDQMKSALKALNLDWAYDVFVHHFGEGDQTSVSFSMVHFVHTFHEIFMRCKAEKKSLHGEFVQLGVVLGLMYESLESIGLPVDVRSAFFRISKLSQGED